MLFVWRSPPVLACAALTAACPSFHGGALILQASHKVEFRHVEARLLVAQAVFQPGIISCGFMVHVRRDMCVKYGAHAAVHHLHF